jgi:RNA polymerase sigma-70 factor, ECF subfamily
VLTCLPQKLFQLYDKLLIYAYFNLKELMSPVENIEFLWYQFNSGLRSFIISRINNDTDADDILQNTYLKIHENIHSLKDNSRIKSWIYQITRNLIIDYFRTEKNNQKLKKEKHELAASSSSGRFVDIAISDMIKTMEDMPPEYCEALCLTEIEGMSQKEFAEKTGLSYSGAKSRVQRARQMLKDMLLKCCHYQFDKYGTVFDIQPKCCCCSVP